jgi:hypothetical protein
VYQCPYVPNYHRRVALEQRVMPALARRAMIERLMRESVTLGPGGDEAPSSVRAFTIRASERPRVRDSFDARPASERSRERPYSARTFAQDVAAVSRPWRETYHRAIVPVEWLEDGAAAAMGRARAEGRVETVTIARERGRARTRRQEGRAPTRWRLQAERVRLLELAGAPDPALADGTA